MTYAAEPLVLCRGDNEGLMEHGLFNRARVDFVWYERLVDEFFPCEPARSAAAAVVRREYTLPRLLLLLACASGDEPQELLARMRTFRYPAAARMLMAIPARSPAMRSALRRAEPPARRLWWRRTIRRSNGTSDTSRPGPPWRIGISSSRLRTPSVRQTRKRRRRRR